MLHAARTTRLWHPFAAMGKVDGHELVLVRGEGSRVWDADGTEYVDATAGLWFANVGHGRAEIADAVAAQLRTLAAHHVFGDHANEPALELAARLAELAPVEDAAVFFGTGGGEAVDAAAKIVRRYWALADQPQRTVLVSRRFAYHGTMRTARRSRESRPSGTGTARSWATLSRSHTTIPQGLPRRSTSWATARRHSPASP